MRINHGPTEGHMYRSIYGHLSVVRSGLGEISQGQWVGTSGDSGYSNPQHLHFEIRHNGTAQSKAVNPDDESGVSLWTQGEWAGWNGEPSQPKARKRLVTLGTYGETVIDDTSSQSNEFRKGAYPSTVCPPLSCPYWYQVTSSGYSGDYYWTSDNNDTAWYWAEWHPNLPAFTLYEVSAHIPCTPDAINEYNTSPTWSTPYTIFHEDGTTSVIVDQLTSSRAGACNQWLGLGVYRGNAGSDLFVNLTDATKETGTGVSRKVLADAVKFTATTIGPFEGENWRKKIARSGDSWRSATEKPQYTGTGYAETFPNDGSSILNNYVTTSPELIYNVVFPTTGTYYIWIRGYGGSGGDDSIHAGFDGQGPPSADRIAGCGWSAAPGSWIWCNTTIDNNFQDLATITIDTPGYHTFHFWMREDGFRVDRIFLTIQPNYNVSNPPNEKPYIFPGDDMGTND